MLQHFAKDWPFRLLFATNLVSLVLLEQFKIVLCELLHEALIWLHFAHELPEELQTVA